MIWKDCNEAPKDRKDTKTAGRIRRLDQWDYFCAYWFDFFGYWSINGHPVHFLQRDKPDLKCEWLDQGEES